MISLQRARDWLKQPTTLLGLAIVGGAGGGAYWHVIGEALASTAWATALPLLLPDNSTDRIKVQDTSNRLLHALATRQAIGTATADVGAVLLPVLVGHADASAPAAADGGAAHL